MAPHLTCLLHLAAPILVSFCPTGALSYKQTGKQIPGPQLVGRGDVSFQHDLFKRAGPTCPADNTNTFASSDGSTYKLACGTEVTGHQLAATVTNDILGCANFCSKYNEDNKGNCGAFTFAESNGACQLNPAGGNVTAITGSDAGTLVQAVSPEPTESAPPFAPSCPSSNETFFTNTGGDLYLIQCSSISTVPRIAYTYGTTISGCMSFCS